MIRLADEQVALWHDELARCATVEDVCRHVSALGAAVLGASVGAVFVRRQRADGSDRYYPAGIWGARFDDFPPLPSINPARLDPANPFYSTFCRPEVSHVADLEAHPAFRGLPEPHPYFRCFLAVPLLDQEGTSRGVFEAGHPEPHRFAPPAIEQMQALAMIAGTRLAAEEDRPA